MSLESCAGRGERARDSHTTHKAVDPTVAAEAHDQIEPTLLRGQAGLIAVSQTDRRPPSVQSMPPPWLGQSMEGAVTGAFREYDEEALWRAGANMAAMWNRCPRALISCRYLDLPRNELHATGARHAHPRQDHAPGHDRRHPRRRSRPHRAAVPHTRGSRTNGSMGATWSNDLSRTIVRMEPTRLNANRIALVQGDRMTLDTT